MLLWGNSYMGGQKWRIYNIKDSCKINFFVLGTSFLDSFKGELHQLEGDRDMTTAIAVKRW